MWWEILPSFSVIAVCIGLYPMSTYVVNRVHFGIPYRRHIMYNGDAHLFLRDERISGCNDAYVQKGLENIPDESSTGTSKAGAAKC